MNPCRHRIQRNAGVVEDSRAQLGMLEIRQIAVHPPPALPRTVHGLPPIDAMDNEVAPIRPADLALLTDLLVRELSRG